jgi:hypothetical protein
MSQIEALKLRLPPPPKPEEDNTEYAPVRFKQQQQTLEIYASAPNMTEFSREEVSVRLGKRSLEQSAIRHVLSIR